MSRKISGAAAIVVAAAVLAPGLSSAEAGLSKGVKVGLNMATATGADADAKTVTGNSGATKGSVTGIAAGLFAGIGLPVLPLSFEIEALYSMKGAKYEWGGNSSTTKLAYLDIPVLVKLDILPLGPVKVGVFAGPSMGILMSAKNELKLGSDTSSTDIKDSLNSSDLGLVVGVGVGLPMGLSADVRYSMGLSKLAKDVSGVTTPERKNGVISLMVGKSF